MIPALLTAAGCILLLDSALLCYLRRTRINLGATLPAILGLPLIVMAFFPPQGALRYIIIAAYAAVAAFFLATTSMLLRAARDRAPYNMDVLVVLGCAVYGVRPSRTLQLRLDAALEYLSHSPDTTVIVSGGLLEDADITEALAMEEYLVRRGVDPARIIQEGVSRSTWENFKFVKPILDERFPGAGVAFITTGFHIYRSGRVAKMHGIEAFPYAARDAWYVAPNNYIREGVAVVWYKLRGLLV